MALPQELNEDAPHLEGKLRPKKLDEYIGQGKAKDALRLFIDAGRKRGGAMEHILFYGPPGMGKTTLAHIVAKELEGDLKITSGPAIEKTGDLAAILTNLKDNDVLFIDEIHRLPRAVEEALYPVMEEFALDIVLGKGAGARTVRLSVPKMIVIGATAKEFHRYLSDSNKILKNPFDEKLTKFAKKQSAPFRILYAGLEKNPDKNEQRAIITSAPALKEAVQKICAERYKLTNAKLRNAAIRSITYIFLTKMILVLIFEIPLTRIIYGELEMLPIAINTLFPPFLMAVIVSMTNPPSGQNTQRIYNRIVDILNSDPAFETKTTLISEDTTSKRPILLLGFTILYLIVFFSVFISIYVLLDMLGFNIISKAIFIFFISVVAFFGYRIRQTAKEYVLEMESNVIVSFITFLFLPILYVGKFLSSQVARINLFIIFFDYIIEAPFKFLIEIVEEWSRFLKARKDELM